MLSFKKLIAVTAMLMAAALTVFSTGCDEKKEESQPAADVLDVTEPPTEAIEITEWPDITTFSDEPDGMLGRARSLRSINDDVVGYIKINGSYVDYPVTQYDGENPDELGNAYYMDKDIYGGYLESGTIFMDYRDDFPPDENQQSNNIVLYGHNMLNGSKFATLHKYRQDDSFYAESPIIEFSSNYADTKYVIFAYFLTSGSPGESAYGEEFTYWNMEDMDEAQFKDYLRICKERSYISPDIDVKYGDQLLTLQTCYMDEDNSRFLVIGRRLREGETVEDFKKIAAKESSNEAEEDNNDENGENADE